MAVARFFLEASGSPPASPSITGDWEHVNTARSPMGLTKDGTALALTSYSPDAADHLVNGDAHFRQFISPALPAQTFAAQTVKLQIQGSETHAGNNCSLTWKLYAVAVDDLAVIGTLVAIRRDATEFTTSVVNRGDSVTSTEVVASESCYLVLEVGLGGTPTGAGGVQGHNGALRFGSNGSSGDLPENDTEAGTTFDPWLELANITPPAQEITGCGNIASGEAFGSDSVDHAVTASGIASAEAFGAATVELGAAGLFIDPAGIVSAEAFGSAVMGEVVAASGIASGEAFGAPGLVLTLDPAGIASLEAFGDATVELGAAGLFIDPTGISSAEAFGAAALAETVAPAGIASAESVGAPSVAEGLAVVGIVSGEAFGLPGLAVVVVATGIASGEDFGAAVVAPVTLLSPTGIASLEAVGEPSLHQQITAVAIPSGELFGALFVDDGSYVPGGGRLRSHGRGRSDDDDDLG